MNKKLDRNYYDILDLERNADDAAIKKAYKKAALVHHPDKGGSDEMFQAVNEAFQVLSDAIKRSDYDKVSVYMPNKFEGFKEVQLERRFRQEGRRHKA